MPPVSSRLDPDRSLWHLIAVEVRRQRELHDLSGYKLAIILDCDRSTVSRIENGLRRLSSDYAAKLDELWKTRGLFTRLVMFANATDGGDWFLGLTELEARAARIKMWETTLVPGLLQTPEYARAALSAGEGIIDDVEKAFQKRMARQAAVFDRPKPPRLWVALSWAVLEQPVGDASVMRGQLARLLEVSELPHVTVRVVEREAGEHVGLDGPCKLLTVDDRDIAFADAPQRGRLITEPADVQEIVMRFDRIADVACTLGPSRALIERVMESYK